MLRGRGRRAPVNHPAVDAGRGEHEAQPPSPSGAVGTATDRVTDSLAASLAEKLAGGRKLIESVIIAVITSTGVYLVGSIYTEAYFGRMSIDAVALDLPPPYIALQATHAVQSLLVYPVVLVMLYLLDRFSADRLPRARSWLARMVDRLGWFAYLAINIIVVLAAGAGRRVCWIESGADPDDLGAE